MEKRDIVIIGSGPAGYTAAIYAGRADMKPLLIAGREAGGQLMLTSEVENWPGEPAGILGSELMDRMRKQSEKFGTEIWSEVVTAVDLSSHPYKLTTGKGEVEANAIIVATGAVAKWLDIPGEKEFQGKGVSACATCDGFFFRDQRVVVVGGGDAAMEEATFITKFAKEVIVIVRGESLRASKIMQQRAQENPKISFRWNTSPLELQGAERLQSVKVKNNLTGEEEIIPTDGFFVAIGHKPNTELFVNQLKLDEKGYIVREPNKTQASVPGVFACGDVMDPWYRQAITASGTGCAAALEAEKYLAGLE